MSFPEFLDGRLSLFSDRLDPFAGNHVVTKEEDADWFVNIDAHKDQWESQVQHHAGHECAGDSERVHADDFQDGAENGVAAGSKQIIVQPVAGTEGSRNTVDEEHVETHLHALTG